MRQDNQRRTLLFIVGMHRSGTSALTAAFCACGATTGEDVLAPMEGVNSEGFWEDRRTVELNEALLHNAGLEWYRVRRDSHLLAFTEDDYERGRAIVTRGFGGGAVEVVKDPRFCLTLPFWLKVCEDVGVVAKVCVIVRNADEVAQSLGKRDAFPLSYGLRLTDDYQYHIDLLEGQYGPFVQTDYDRLLASPAAELGRLSGELQLPQLADTHAVLRVIKPALKHQNTTAEVGERRGDEQQLTDVLSAFVARGEQLTSLGVSHTEAQATVAERDKQLAEVQLQLTSLGVSHTQAQATVGERDKQLAEVQQQLTNLGVSHTQAQAIVGERDQQLAEVQQQLTSLGVSHTEAQATVGERDQQLADTQAQLQQLGQEHGHAIAVVVERDAQLTVLHSDLIHSNEALIELQQELQLTENELLLHKSWKRKFLLALGFNASNI